MLRVLFFALMALGASAHLCLISPHQRGTMAGINSPGSDDCLLIKDPPCGGREPAEPSVAIRPGDFNITFQKNLNHYYATSPGSFIVSFGTKEKLTELTSFPDTNTSSLHLYQVAIEIPATHEPHAIIQVQYKTNNPEAPPVFYQCADVMVMGKKSDPRLRIF